MTPAHRHLKPVARRVEDYQNEILRRLLDSPPGGPMPCLYFFLLLLLYALWLLWVGSALGSLVGSMLPGGPGNGGVALVAAAQEGTCHGPRAWRHAAALVQQGGACSPQRHAAMSDGCSPECFGSCLAHSYSGLHRVSSSWSVPPKELYGEVLNADGAVMAWGRPL